ncbi:hypothetical protein KEM56_003080 [Ascosphaera pollenicola]|nr:hypothetical protein KEM56_003080 [Ascosphaera pollenicola]
MFLAAVVVTSVVVIWGVPGPDKPPMKDVALEALFSALPSLVARIKQHLTPRPTTGQRLDKRLQETNHLLDKHFKKTNHLLDKHFKETNQLLAKIIERQPSREELAAGWAHIAQTARDAKITRRELQLLRKELRQERAVTRGMRNPRNGRKCRTAQGKEENPRKATESD